MSGPSCYGAPANPGGEEPYENQSYCVSFSGTTDILYAFTGTLSFTTAPMQGPLVNCQYWSSGTVTGVTGTQTTGPTPCTGSVNAGTGALSIQDAYDNVFAGTFSGSSVSGSYNLDVFGPTSAVGGNVQGTFGATPPTP